MSTTHNKQQTPRGAIAYGNPLFYSHCPRPEDRIGCAAFAYGNPFFTDCPSRDDQSDCVKFSYGKPF